ncbi:MAG: SMC-Scp complex subunit ScpB [Armatimonadota bacterium]|nr:SMC-Scp complex subunit ScpB [Armatimonadota bacterium]
MDQSELMAVLECLLFASREPVRLARLAEVAEQPAEKVLEALEQLRARPGGGLQVAEVAGGWMLCTRSEYAGYVTRMLQVQPPKLSRAALETLAIIAYRQPITAPEVEAIRGVSVDGVLAKLEACRLIRGTGRKQAPGRPILYETTEEFLRCLGLRNLAELPELEK